MAFALSRSARRVLQHGVAWPLVASALVTTLRRTRDHTDVDRILKHLLISIDEPRPDRVHVQVRRGTDVFPLGRALELFPDGEQLSPVVDRIESLFEGMFDVDMREAHRRVVSIYTINWSNFMPYAPAVKARFILDPREVQEEFLAEFLELYDQGTDVTHLQGADEAAAWLRAHRRFLARHTIVLRDAVPAPRLDELEGRLREAMEAFSSTLTGLPAHGAWLRQIVERLQHVPSPGPASALEGLPQIFAELGVPLTRRSFLELLAIVDGELQMETLPEAVATPEQQAAWTVLRAAGHEALLWGW